MEGAIPGRRVLLLSLGLVSACSPPAVARGRVVVETRHADAFAHVYAMGPCCLGFLGDLAMDSARWRMCLMQRGSGMAKLVCGMNQTLDGYVDHMAFSPDPVLFRHFIEEAQEQAGSLYGRKMYEVMRYWDDDHAEWDAEEHAFAAAWRAHDRIGADVIKLTYVPV